MQFTGFKGEQAELRVGGRRAATIKGWSLQPTGEDQVWILEGASNGDVDQYWMASGGPFELRVTVRNRYWRWADVQVLGTNPFTIRGKGNPEVM